MCSAVQAIQSNLPYFCHKILLEINMASKDEVMEKDVLRDVCELLVAEGIIDQELQRDLQGSSVAMWFQSISKSLKEQYKEDPLRTETETSTNCRIIKVVPRLLQMLRECMLTHRWEGALSVLQGIANEPYNTSVTLWKISMELLYKDPDVNSELIDNQIRNLKGLKDYSGKEVILEYIMFLLHQGKLQQAKSIYQEAPSKKGTLSGKIKHTELLFQAYQGLVLYMEWITLRQKHERTTSEMKDDVFQHGASVCVDYDVTMKICADKAGDCFHELYSEMGVWDIFVTKHVEMLEYYQRSGDALDVLEMFRDKNPENLNSHKYMYEFWVRHNAKDDKILHLLQNVAECCPSDSLVLELCDRLLAAGEVNKALPMIFTLQDYSCWQHQERSWKLLSRVLSSAVTEGLDSSTLKECWDFRKSWWPVYHFVYTNCEDCSPEVWMYKACCCCILQRSDEFLSKVTSILDDRQKKELHEYNSKMEIERLDNT